MWMNWDAVGAMAEMLAAMGVIVSVLYLAFQVRTANRDDRIESARSVMQIFHENSRDMSINPEFRRICAKVASGEYSDMTAEECFAWDTLMWRYIGNAADALQLHKKGLLDKEPFDVIMDSMLVTINSVPDWWSVQSRSHITPPSLLKYLNERIDDGTSTRISWGEQHTKWTLVK
jgi:hypothetical protein